MDYRIIGDDELYVNHAIVNYMNHLVDRDGSCSEVRNTLFPPELRQFRINAHVRNSNFYYLDIYGLVIRKEAQNLQKSPFGWKIVNNEPVSVHVDRISLRINDKAIVRRLVLQKLKNKWPTQFVKDGIYYRALIEMSPDPETIENLLNDPLLG